MNLSKKQKELFDALHEDKVQDYKVFSKRDYGRLFSSLIDKYPESAHFVYELLQNAEDANATHVSIILKDDKLIFKHDGTKHFDVTPLDSPKIGDINSITGFGFSSKVEDLDDEQAMNSQKIGKFGVGFKSVFQYTDTPEIYDDIYCFKIENYIIPTLLDHDDPSRKQGETMFVFRFKEQNRAQAYDHIKRRLENLRSPLLFLRNIKKITWRIDSGNGVVGKEATYEKQLVETQKYDRITLERYHLIEPKETSSIFLFSKQVEVQDKGRFPIYVGYYYDEEKKQLITNVTRNIYCFFPTKVSFKTCFIAHAPFLLTDNRQDLKPDTDINADLVSDIAYLAAQTVVLLRDYGIKHKNLLINENITEICPQYESHYYDEDETIYEEPFKEAFKEILSEEPLLLSRADSYILPSKAYTTHKGVFALLNQEQFEMLRTDEDDYYNNAEGVDFLQWELSQNILNLDDECEYFEEVQRYDIEDFGHDITADFMDKMEFEWVIKFYTFLRNHASEHINITNQSKSGELVFRGAPIIKTQKNEWVRPFINKTTPNVYLPIQGSTDKSSGYNFVNNQYLNDPLAMKLFTMLELKKPDEYDYIRNIILKKYTAEEVEIEDDVLRADFEVLLDYYQRVQHTDKEDEFVNMVKNSILLVGKNETLYKPNQLFLETPVLAQYFEGDNEIVFFDLYYYRKHIHTFKTSFITDFVCLLGLQTKPQVTFDVSFSSYSLPKHIKQYVDTLSYYEFVKLSDPKLQGFVNACSSHHITKELSVYLWNEIICDYTNQKSAEIYTRQKHKQYSNVHYCQSTFLHDLLNNEWIYDKDGQLRIATELHIEDLAPEYNLANGIIEFFGITKAVENLTEKYGATQEEQDVFDFGAKAMAAGKGLTEEEKLAVLEKAAKEKETALAQKQQPNTTLTSNDPLDAISEEEKETIKERLKKELTEEKARKQQQEVDKAKLDKLRATEQQEELPRHTQTDYSNKQLFDKPADNPTTTPQHKSDTSLALSDEEIAERQEQENNRRNLIDIAEDDSKRYTFEWFNALLELEFQASDEASTSSRGINLVFSKVEKDPNSDRGILLRNPSRYIPRALEEMENISVTFYLPDNLHITITFEVASVQDYVLRLKCKNEDVEQVSNLLQVAYKVYRAEIKTSSPIKLISELQTSFRALNFNDVDSLLDNLNPTIKFVFGPPGTGKTTHLVKNWINKVATRPRARMLILCPTNKAADVIAKRALETINPKACPENWLYRFVATADDTLENHVCTRDSNIFEQPKCCVISTIARFSYDGFTGKKLKEIDWDYIIIDEASMIPLAEIVYPLYRCPSAQIVIAGDPFQIEPIVNEDRWKDENIYTMVNLNDFSNPKTVPVQFDILNLPVQYRAVPSIGRLFSEYAYDGGVSSNRDQSSQRKLTIENYDVKSVNFVMFPVDYFSIFEPHNIGNSPIHIYSALFTFEFVKYLAKNIEKQQDDKPWRIGVISPYRAQSEVINKLWEQRTELYPNVEVSIGTVHGFQGDECDIIIAVYNPPASGLKRAADRTFVNKKNILNVAISRAQDYLFILMPDRDFEHYDKLETKTIGYIAEKDAKEMTTITSQKLEKVIFNDVHFIEKNTFVTTHQLANVYTAPASLYEVRFDDKSVDIQIQ